jgi:hypothetical protein
MIPHEYWINNYFLEITQTIHSNDSTTEVEFVAAAEATKEIVCLKKILEDL